MHRTHYFLVDSFFIWLCYTSFKIFTSLLSPDLPWYEPDGMQFMIVLLIILPLMIGAGFLLRVVGESIPINRRMKKIPFVVSIGLFALIIFDGSLSLFMQITGAIICIFAVIATVAFFVIDIIQMNRAEHGAGE